MEILLNKEAKKIIKDTLGLNKKKMLSEALVAQEKTFDIKTDFLSETSVKNHIELYQDYIKKFNEISAKLDTVDISNVNSSHSDYRSIKNDETFNMNASYLHELYFSNIGDNASSITMDSLSYMRLNRDFGTFDDWQKDFMASANSSRCGWAVTYLNIYTQAYANCFIDLHSLNVPVGMYPVIVIDMWQHAYYKDYLKNASTYLTAMMKQLRWSVIEKRFEKADKLLEIVRGV